MSPRLAGGASRNALQLVRLYSEAGRGPTTLRAAKWADGAHHCPPRRNRQIAGSLARVICATKGMIFGQAVP